MGYGSNEFKVQSPTALAAAAAFSNAALVSSHRVISAFTLCWTDAST
jgi:hypothetical protein